MPIASAMATPSTNTPSTRIRICCVPSRGCASRIAVHASPISAVPMPARDSVKNNATRIMAADPNSSARCATRFASNGCARVR